MRKGQRHSSETRAKIRAAKIGKKFAPEHKKNISNSLTGRSLSPLHKKNISEGKRIPRLGRNQVSNTTDPTQAIKDTSNQQENKTMNISHEKDDRIWDVFRVGRIAVCTRRSLVIIRLFTKDDYGQEVMTDEMLRLSRSDANRLLQGLSRALK